MTTPSTPPPITVLVVDDDPAARELLADQLLEAGHRVETAENGRQALDMAAKLLPDLVLLDIMMPGMDGFAVCRELRAHPPLADITVVLVTALDDRTSRLLGLEAGADDFVSKPYDSAELQARVRTIARLNRYRRMMRERARFEWVVESSDDGYLLLDAEDRVLYANPAARLFLGGLPEDTGKLGKSFLDIARIQFRLASEGAWRKWPEETAATRYLVRPEAPHADPLWLHVEALEVPEETHGERLVRLRDDTSQILLERDMWQLNALVAHKLRSPLTVILGGLDLFEEDVSDRPKEEILDIYRLAASSAQRLKDQLQAMLELLDAPQLAQGEEGCDVMQIPAILEELEDTLGIDDVHITIDPELEDAHLALAPVAVEIALREVLANSRKFHPDQAPTVDIRVTPVRVGERDAAVLTLTDNGSTVPPERWAQVWTPYYQSEGGFAGQPEGMGLGLARVGSMVWSVGGRCQLRNLEPGPGVVVELTVPLASEDEE